MSAAVAGCAGDDAPPPVDTALVDVLVEVHLADARGAYDTTATDARADSLRRAALAAHGLDSAALAGRLDALARDPARARATYDAVDERLVLERQGVGPAGAEATGARAGVDTLALPR